MQKNIIPNFLLENYFKHCYNIVNSKRLGLAQRRHFFKSNAVS